MKKKIGIAAVLVTCLMSCGKGDDQNNPVDGSTFGGLGIVGKWQNTCQNQGAASYRTTVTFQTSSMERQFTRFVTKGCRTGDENVIYHYQYQNANQITPSDLNGYITVRESVAQITAELRTSALVTSFNKAARYGYKNWQLNVAMDISGRKYQASEAPEANMNDTRYITISKQASALLFAVYVNGSATASQSPEERFQSAQ